MLAEADLIRTLARAHGAVSIELFGSAARGEDRADSDIDIMVELERVLAQARKEVVRIV